MSIFTGSELQAMLHLHVTCTVDGEGAASYSYEVIKSRGIASNGEIQDHSGDGYIIVPFQLERAVAHEDRVEPVSFFTFQEEVNLDGGPFIPIAISFMATGKDVLLGFAVNGKTPDPGQSSTVGVYYLCFEFPAGTPR